MQSDIQSDTEFQAVNGFEGKNFAPYEFYRETCRQPMKLTGKIC